ncbi:MAG: hypothetical protein FWC95_04220 [Defluviitaleaceae bacterium]|nr:hypothetical protein [Defluviitaleaceae bacterium]
MVIADAISRFAVANMPDVWNEIFVRNGDVYVGFLPESVRILVHELFHARQDELFIGRINAQAAQARNIHINELNTASTYV